MTRGKKGQSRTVEPTAGELGTYYAQKILGHRRNSRTVMNFLPCWHKRDTHQIIFE